MIELIVYNSVLKGIGTLINIKVDAHTHTIASGHAFSTIEENAIHASKKGIEAIGMTDHFGPMFWQSSEPVFNGSLNMAALPKVIHGVRILAGTEIDIMDLDGNLAGHDLITPFRPDMNACELILTTREITIASLHFLYNMENATKEQYTNMYCNVIKNPYVNIIGHLGRMDIPLDIETIVACAKENNVCIEINSSTLNVKSTHSRCRNIALCCKKLNAPIVVDSDAHSSFFIGEITNAANMLEEINFPEELVINSETDRFFDFFDIER